MIIMTSNPQAKESNNNLGDIWKDESSIFNLDNNKIYLGEGDLGKGVFAKRLLRKGEIILKFKGPIIGFEDAVAKGEKECWPLQVEKTEYIDLEEPGCFANHSCNPNSGIVANRILVAIKNIEMGTEIRYDYSTTVDEDYWRMECRCKSNNCRNIISDFKYLDENLRAYYLSLGIVQSFISSQYKPPSNHGEQPD